MKAFLLSDARSPASEQGSPHTSAAQFSAQSSKKPPPHAQKGVRLVIAFPCATIERPCILCWDCSSSTAQSLQQLPTAFRFLSILLAAIPVLALTDDWLVQDVSAIVAALLLLFAIGASQDDLKITVRLLGKIKLPILFPFAWMVFQIAPLSLFANSIWPTASIALNEPLSGHISIDPGATIRALFQYLTIASLMVATMVFTRDRERAETTLFVMGAVTTFMSVEMLLGQFQPFTGIVPAPGNPGAASFVAISALGAVVNAAAAVRIIERRLSRREEANALSPILAFCLGLAGSASCLGAIIVAGRTNTLILAGFGIAVILLVGASRLIAPRPAALGVLFAIFALAVTGTIALRFEDNSALIAILRFAASASTDSLSVTQHAFADLKWVGSGVGTFDTLVPIYREFGGRPVVEPASTIAKIAIEWGRAGSFVLVFIGVQLFVVMFRGALRRGRDWFFPAAASASILVLFCEAFCDTSLTHPSSQIILAVIIGLGLSQTMGRTSGL